MYYLDDDCLHQIEPSLPTHDKVTPISLIWGSAEVRDAWLLESNKIHTGFNIMIWVAGDINNSSVGCFAKYTYIRNIKIAFVYTIKIR